MQATTNLAAALTGLPGQAPWTGQRSVVPVDAEFIARIAAGATVHYATEPSIDSAYEVGQFAVVDGRPSWVRHSDAGELIGRRELADGELEALVLKLCDPTILDDAVMDAVDAPVAMGALARMKLSKELAGKTQELAAIPAGSAGDAMASMRRAKLANEVNALLAALFGSKAADPVDAVDADRAVLEKEVVSLRAEYPGYKVTLAAKANIGTRETLLTMERSGQVGNGPSPFVFTLKPYKDGIMWESVDILSGTPAGTMRIGDGGFVFVGQLSARLGKTIESSAGSNTLTAYDRSTVDPRPTAHAMGAGKKNVKWRAPIVMPDGRTVWANGEIVLFGTEAPFEDMTVGSDATQPVPSGFVEKLLNKARAGATQSVDAIYGYENEFTKYDHGRKALVIKRSQNVALVSGDDVVGLQRIYLAMAQSWCGAGHVLRMGEGSDTVYVMSADGAREAVIAPKKVQFTAAELLKAQHVEDAPPGTPAETQAAPDQAIEAGAGNAPATAAPGIEAGTVEVEAAGVDAAEPPDKEFKKKVLDAAYSGKGIELIDSDGFLAAKMNKTGRPVFVIDGTFGRPEYKAMIAEAVSLSLPTEKIYVFCNFATYSGLGIEALLIRDLHGFDEQKEPPAQAEPAQAAINTVASIPAENDVPGMARFISTSVEAGVIADLRKRAEKLPEGDSKRDDLLKNAAWREKDVANSEHLASRGLALATSIAEKRVFELLERLSINNINSKKAFSAITGVKLPATDKATKDVLIAWSGMTPEQFNTLEAARSASRDAAQLPKDIKSRIEWTRGDANRLKINGLSGADWVDKNIADGLTLLLKTGDGKIKKWGMYDPETRSGYVLARTELASYAKAAIAKADYEKETGITLDSARFCESDEGLEFELDSVDLQSAGPDDQEDDDGHGLIKPVALDSIRERASLDRDLIAMGMRPDDEYIARTYGKGWKMAPVVVVPVLDDAGSMRHIPVMPDSTVVALAAVTGRMASMLEANQAAMVEALTAKPAPIELTLKNEAMRVTVEQPASIVNVNVPEQAAPIVQITNEVPAAQVVVNGPARSISEVERDPATQEILRTVTKHEMA